MNGNESINPKLIAFLCELRRRLLITFIVLFILFAGLLYFANPLYRLLALPLLRFLPQGHLIATEVVAPLFVPFRLAFAAALLITAPVFLYQVWAFIAPALYHYEKRLVWPFLLVSTTLFYAGMIFAYLVIFPLLFHFLTRIAPEGVLFSPDIGQYLDFTLKLLLIFGSLFEIPMVMVLLVYTNMVTRARFIRSRPYAVIAAFVLGMLLAPPDVLSQTILAIPIILLYEAGIQLSRFVERLR